MTISSTTRTAGPFTGNDVTTAFPFAFKVFAAADLRVVELDVASGIETDLVITTDYTVSLNADQNANPGGTVTLVAALATGKKLTVTSDIDALQSTDLSNQGGFYPSVITNALDKLTILVQQALESITRSVRLPISVTGVSTQMPIPEANALLSWNETATGLQNADPTTLATIVAFGTAEADVFSGDGATLTFTLSSNPGALNNLDVSIGGVTQTPGADYTWTAGTTLTFTSAPPSGTNNILVRYMQGLPQGTTDWNNVTSRPEVFVTDDAYGAVGDGVTNDYTAFVNALAAAGGKKLRIPAGTYNLTFTGLTAFTPPANVVIEGDGSDVTILNVTPPNSASYPKMLALSAGGFAMRGVQINYLTPSGGTGILFSPSSNNLRFEDVVFDGTVTNSGASISHENHCIGVPSSGTSNDVEFINCDFTRWRYTLLKANASTCTNRRWSFAHCDSYGSYNEDLSFNSPDGVFDDIQVYMCRFRDGAGDSASLEQLYVAFASATNFRVSGCSFIGEIGTGGQAVHVEEHCIGGTITGNTFNVSGYALQMNGEDNNTGLVVYTPRQITFSGNTIVKYGTLKEAGSIAIGLVSNVAADPPAESTVIADNNVYGYETGIYAFVVQSEGLAIRGNTLDNCSYGMKLFDGAATISGNTTKDCTVGILGEAGLGSYECAVVADHNFINCTTNVDSTDLPVTLMNPTFVFDRFNHAGGSTSVYKDCLPAGANDRFHGFLEISESCDGANDFSRVRDEVTWDGTTFTRTNKITIQPGSINTLAARNSSILAVQVFASTAETNVRVQARLNGMAVIAV